jgi:hypothetical protein
MSSLLVSSKLSSTPSPTLFTLACICSLLDSLSFPSVLAQGGWVSLTINDDICISLLQYPSIIIGRNTYPEIGCRLREKKRKKESETT